jgi:hypothetical protein
MAKKGSICVEHPSRPYDNAMRFLHRHYAPGDDFRLRHHRGIFYENLDKVFRPRDTESIKSDL